MPNPFRARWRAPSSVSEVPVAIDAILVGTAPDRAAAVVNGEVCSSGDSIGGATIGAITEEAVEMRCGLFRARLPTGKPGSQGRFLLRMPRETGPAYRPPSP